MNKTNLKYLSVLILLQIVDILTTITALEAGAIEANPIILFLMNKFGMVAALIITKTAAILAFFICILCNTKVRTLRNVMIFACSVYFLLMINNFIVIFCCM